MQAHEKNGQGFVAAPVFGRPEAAMAAKLFVVAAGSPAALAVCDPLFKAIGQKTFVFGEAPKAANIVKLSGNFLIASVIEALSEAMALVGKAEIDRRRTWTSYLDPLNAPVYKTYGELIVEKKFTPAGFAVPLGQKDIRLALAAGEDLRVPMPLASLLRDRFLALLAQGGEALDWSALGQLAAQIRPDRRLKRGGSAPGGLLPWLPGTNASVAKRITCMQAVARIADGAGWDLAVGLLPSTHSVSDMTARPRYREAAAQDESPAKLSEASGYRVVCIDQKPVHGSGLMWTHIPDGVEDETGDRAIFPNKRAD